jgi:pimeloyl-ACP methyl ester carboxylesterase
VRARPTVLAVVAALLCGQLGAVAMANAAMDSAVLRVLRIATAEGDTIVATSYGATETLDGAAVAQDSAAAPVVFVPGLLGSAYTFRGIAPVLAETGRRVVVIEPLGTGASARPADGDYSLEAQAARIGAALDTLGIGNATLVCHSVGASMCFRLALQRPSLVRGIISINGGPDEVAATGGLKTALRLAPILKLFGAQRILRGKVSSGLRDSSADPSWVTDAVVAGYTAPFKDFDAVLRSFRGMVNAEADRPLTPRLSQITQPVTVLVGAGNPEGAISAEDLQVLVAAIPQLVVSRVPEAGQYIQEERPDAVMQAVLLQQTLH